MIPERAYAYKVLAAALLEAVLSESISSRMAINAWPPYINQDASVQTAYTMLWFFESDDDRRYRESFYSDLQLKLLTEVATHLKQGQLLPTPLLREYQAFAAPVAYEGTWFWQQPWWWFKRQVGQIKGILYTNPLMQKDSKVRPRI